MTPNQRTIHEYMDAFRVTDRARVMACLTEDVEWVLPGVFRIKGKAEFSSHIVDEGFIGHPAITVYRMIEDQNVVVAEGSVRAAKQDGTFLDLVFCDVFDMRDAKVRRLISYLVVASPDRVDEHRP